MPRLSHLITRFEAAALLGVILSVLTANIAVFGQECDQLRSEVVRLHILANSDSEHDQQIKLAVRDRILLELGGVFEAPASQTEAQQTALELLPEIQRISTDVLAENGLTLPVTAELCRMPFDTRDYAAYSLPAGIYDAVRVSIGTGAGRNWWCVMYPPICIPAAASSEPLEAMPAMNDLQELNNQPMFKPKLAVVELFETVKAKLSDDQEALTTLNSDTASEIINTP